jgi:hypothetical protein
MKSTYEIFSWKGLVFVIDQLFPDGKINVGQILLLVAGQLRPENIMVDTLTIKLKIRRNCGQDTGRAKDRWSNWSVFREIDPVKLWFRPLGCCPAKSNQDEYPT